MELLKIIKQAAKEAVEESTPTNVMMGTVKQVNPLVINVEQRLDIPASCLYLTDEVRDYETELSFDTDTINMIQNHSVKQTEPYNLIDSGSYSMISFVDRTVAGRVIKNKITVYNGLKVGEKVLLVRSQGGQQYIVLNRLVSAG